VTRYGLDGSGIDSRGGGRDFPSSTDRPWRSPSLLYNGYWVMPGDKAAGVWRCHPPLTPRLKKELSCTTILRICFPGRLWGELLLSLFFSFRLACYTDNKKVSCCSRRFLTFEWTLWRTHCIAFCSLSLSLSHTHALQATRLTANFSLLLPFSE
jgi:hypothetical protein